VSAPDPATGGQRPEPQRGRRSRGFPFGLRGCRLARVRLRAAALQLLEEDGLEFEEAGSVLRIAYSGRSGRFLLLLRLDEEGERALCFAISPIEAGSRVAAVAELLHRVNLELAVVAFDLDPDTGVIRCRAGLDLEGEQLTPARVGKLVYACAAGLDRYLPAILSVVTRGQQPSGALAALGD